MKTHLRLEILWWFIVSVKDVAKNILWDQQKAEANVFYCHITLKFLWHKLLVQAYDKNLYPLPTIHLAYTFPPKRKALRKQSYMSHSGIKLRKYLYYICIKKNLENHKFVSLQTKERNYSFDWFISSSSDSFSTGQELKVVHGKCKDF